jgi:di/tricarboxylate transporter
MNAEAWLMVALLVILFSLLIWGKLPTWLVFFGCILFTNIITNAAAASIMFPVALLLSTTLGVSFTPFAVVLMLGTSYAFINPAGYQTNLMVQEPGNYTFLDFAKLGLPLTILVIPSKYQNLYGREDLFCKTRDTIPPLVSIRSG